MLFTKANADDLMSLLAGPDQLTQGRWRYARLMAQLAISECRAVYGRAEDARPLAVVGITPLPGAAGECWFGVGAGVIGPVLNRFVRRARDHLRASEPDYPGGLISLVKVDHRAGERLAALLGFRPLPVVLRAVLGPHREWRYQHGLYEKRRRGRGWCGVSPPIAATGAAAQNICGPTKAAG